MALIHVPRPKQSALDLDRPVSSLLKTQIEHFYNAEIRLTSRYQTGIYVNAIRTEGEAANYIRAATEAIQHAHDDAARQRVMRARRSKRIEIAAAAQVKRTKRAQRKKRNTLDR